MLVSPTEPSELKLLGTVSSIPEKYGVDFLIPSPVFGRVGVQRKEVKDLVASLHDGRMDSLWKQRELGQAIWLIEGEIRWTNDGELLSSATRTKYTKAMHLGVLLSLQSKGCWVLNSTSLTDSIVLLSSLSRWLTKEKHTSLLVRPGPTSLVPGGDLTDRRIHVMQGFEGVGYEKARGIVEEFGGLPFTLTEDLTKVKGVGKKLAEKIRTVVDG